MTKVEVGQTTSNGWTKIAESAEVVEETLADLVRERRRKGQI